MSKHILSHPVCFGFFFNLFRPVSFDVALSGDILLSLPITNYSSPAVTGTHKFSLNFGHVAYITATKDSWVASLSYALSIHAELRSLDFFQVFFPLFPGLMCIHFMFSALLESLKTY